MHYPDDPFVPPVSTELNKYLNKQDHSYTKKWHSLGPPQHLQDDSIETTLVPSFCKSATEELTSFLEEYFWRVDSGTQQDIFKCMFTPNGMYYNNGLKILLQGQQDFTNMDNMRGQIWLKHQMDRMSILPSFDSAGSVIVHVLGSSWAGRIQPAGTVNENPRPHSTIPFSETFELVKIDDQWKISRVILMSHYGVQQTRKELGN